ncbi:histidine kinase [Streptomyces lasalocidi]
MPDGTDSSPTRVRLCYGDDVLGFIEYGPKAQGRFTPEDRDLVETLARQAALAVHNARLNAELSIRIEEVQRQASELNASRTRIVQAQDTERRGIERQLHDGIQQELVALVAKLRLARNQLCRNGDTVHTTLTELQDDACRVIDGLRELAHGIHPPVLTDQGLAAAVMSRARRLPIPVTVEIEPSVRAARFTPDIEEAAFFVVSEALTNVLKHARAAGVTVRIGRAGGSLLLDVSDDGVGLCSTAGLGSGLTGMRDRIEAVGGELSIIEPARRRHHTAGAHHRDATGDRRCLNRRPPGCGSSLPRTTTWCARAPAVCWRTPARWSSSPPSARRTNFWTRSSGCVPTP